MPGESVKEEDGKAMHDKIVKASQKVADDYNKAAKGKKEVKASGTAAKEGSHCESTDSKLYTMVKKMMKEGGAHWDLEDEIRDMEKRLKDKIYKDEWDRRDDEAVALQARIDKKKKELKDKESRTTYS